MDGSEVFTFASRIMGKVCQNVADNVGVTMDDIAYSSTSGNMRILQNAAKRLNISMDRIYSNLENTGNISSASIPVCIDEMHSKGLIKKGDKIIIVGFGGGLTYGASLLTWSKDD